MEVADELDDEPDDLDDEPDGSSYYTPPERHEQTGHHRHSLDAGASRLGSFAAGSPYMLVSSWAPGFYLGRAASIAYNSPLHLRYGDGAEVGSPRSSYSQQHTGVSIQGAFRHLPTVPEQQPTSSPGQSPGRPAATATRRRARGPLPHRSPGRPCSAQKVLHLGSAGILHLPSNKHPVQLQFPAATLPSFRLVVPQGPASPWLPRVVPHAQPGDTPPPDNTAAAALGRAGSVTTGTAAGNVASPEAQAAQHSTPLPALLGYPMLVTPATSSIAAAVPPCTEAGVCLPALLTPLTAVPSDQPSVISSSVSLPSSPVACAGHQGPGVTSVLLPAADVQSSGPQLATCSYCGNPRPCKAPCPLAVAVAALDGLHLTSMYSTGRFRVACFVNDHRSSCGGSSAGSTPRCSFGGSALQQGHHVAASQTSTPVTVAGAAGKSAGTRSSPATPSGSSSTGSSSSQHPQHLTPTCTPSTTGYPAHLHTGYSTCSPSTPTSQVTHPIPWVSRSPSPTTTHAQPHSPGSAGAGSAAQPWAGTSRSSQTSPPPTGCSDGTRAAAPPAAGGKATMRRKGRFLIVDFDHALAAAKAAALAAMMSSEDGDGGAQAATDAATATLTSAAAAAAAAGPGLPDAQQVLASLAPVIPPCQQAPHPVVLPAGPHSAPLPGAAEAVAAAVMEHAANAVAGEVLTQACVPPIALATNDMCAVGLVPLEAHDQPGATGAAGAVLNNSASAPSLLRLMCTSPAASSTGEVAGLHTLHSNSSSDAGLSQRIKQPNGSPSPPPTACEHQLGPVNRSPSPQPTARPPREYKRGRFSVTESEAPPPMLSQSGAPPPASGLASPAGSGSYAAAAAAALACASRPHTPILPGDSGVPAGSNLNLPPIVVGPAAVLTNTSFTGFPIALSVQTAPGSIGGSSRSEPLGQAAASTPGKQRPVGCAVLPEVMPLATSFSLWASPNASSARVQPSSLTLLPTVNSHDTASCCGGWDSGDSVAGELASSAGSSASSSAAALVCCPDLSPAALASPTVSPATPTLQTTVYPSVLVPITSLPSRPGPLAPVPPSAPLPPCINPVLNHAAAPATQPMPAVAVVAAPCATPLGGQLQAGVTPASQHQQQQQQPTLPAQAPTRKVGRFLIKG